MGDESESESEKIIVDVGITSDSIASMEATKCSSYADLATRAVDDFSFVPFIISTRLTISRRAIAFYTMISQRHQLATIGQYSAAGCARDIASILVVVAEYQASMLKETLGVSELDFTVFSPASHGGALHKTAHTVTAGGTVESFSTPSKRAKTD